MDAGQQILFGDVLRRYRRAAGLTQEELAARAGLSVRGLSDLERGLTRAPRRDTVDLLATALDLPPQHRRALASAVRPRGVLPWPEVHTPHAGAAPIGLVGRAHELARLVQHLLGVGPPLLLVAGEPGIGKSRLLQEIMARAMVQGWCVVRGGCQRRGGQEPFAPILGALQGFLRDRAAKDLRRDLQGCAWLVRLLPELAAGPIEPLPPWALSPDQERRLMFEAVVRFLGSIAGASGTLVVLDDLQWAGSDALDLLSTITRAAAGRLRLVGAYRDTELASGDSLGTALADLAQAGLAAHCRLGPLAPPEATELARAFLLHGANGEAAAEPPDELWERLLRRAGGVPFFLVSCAQGLADGAFKDGAPDLLPWTVTQSIQQRIATLAAAGQQLLASAAILGRLVPRTVLVSMLDLPAGEILAALEAACRARLLEEDGRGGYRFAHDVIREVVEGNLSAARRLLLHRRAGEALEAQQGEQPLEALAFHYRLAEEWARAVPYLIQAGDSALAAYASHDAWDLYGHGIAACERLQTGALPAALVLVGKRKEIGLARGDPAAIDTDIAWLSGYARRWGDRRGAAMALVLRAEYEIRLDRLVPAEETLREALALAGEEYRDVRCLASSKLSIHLFAGGRKAEAGALREVAVSLLDGLDDPGLRRDVAFSLAEWANWTGRFPEALDWLGPRPAGDLTSLGEAPLLGGIKGGLGDYQAALLLLAESLSLAEATGSDAFSAILLNTLGWIHGELQDHQRALDLNGRSVEKALGLGARRAEVESNARLNLADSLLALGRLRDAKEQLQIVERVVRQPDPEDRQRWRYAQHYCHSSGVLWRARGDMVRALACADECLERAERYESRKYIVVAHRLRAEVYLAQGRLPEAKVAINQALTLARQVGNPPQLWKTLAVLGELRQAQGRGEEARQANGEALAVIGRVAAGLSGQPDLRQTFLASAHVEQIRQRALAKPAAQLRERASASPSLVPPTRSERQAWVLAQLREAGAISPREYAAALGVSPDTALRDLQDLARRGLVRASGSTRDRRYVAQEAALR